MVTFSVVTPVFNGMPQLRRCVGSVRGQAGVTVRHLVQDALSTDGTAEWLNEQPDLSVVSARDGGMYDAVNRGWARSAGDILSWLNADEQYLPGTLSAVAQTFEARPDVDLVFGDALIVDPAGDLIAARREVPLRRIYVAGSFLYSLSCTMFFRRSLFDSGDLVFDPSRRVAGDIELVLALLEKGLKAHHISRYLALFTIDGANLSMSADGQRERDEIKLGAGPVGAGAIASGARRIEKAIRGCYRRLPVAYDWAEDERPSYRHLAYDHAPTRFEWARPEAGQLLSGA
jgi:glycosyltransferase involved in cell wall biosynthesis